MISLLQATLIVTRCNRKGSRFSAGLLGFHRRFVEEISEVVPSLGHHPRGSCRRITFSGKVMFRGNGHPCPRALFLRNLVAREKNPVIASDPPALRFELRDVGVARPGFFGFLCPSHGRFESKLELVCRRAAMGFVWKRLIEGLSFSLKMPGHEIDRACRLLVETYLWKSGALALRYFHISSHDPGEPYQEIGFTS